MMIFKRQKVLMVLAAVFFAGSVSLQAAEDAGRQTTAVQGYSGDAMTFAAQSAELAGQASDKAAEAQKFARRAYRTDKLEEAKEYARKAMRASEEAAKFADDAKEAALNAQNSARGSVRAASRIQRDLAPEAAR